MPELPIDKMRQAMKLWRATSKLGAPGALPMAPELLPMGVRVVGQGYLNRFSLPLLTGWLLPRWMHEQIDPCSPLFTPRSVSNLMLNQTHRNWTALGAPGAEHPVESTVDTWGLLTPVAGGPSLDWWAQVQGGDVGWIAAGMQADVLQRLQGEAPVVLTAYETNGLRVSSESWVLPLAGADWAVMQVVLFNIADMRLRGNFAFALRPYYPEGIAPVYSVAYDGHTLRAGRQFRLLTWPDPVSWAFSDLHSGDLFGKPRGGRSGKRALHDPHGFAHALLQFSFDIEPWEEAEFLAFMPIHSHPVQHKASVAERIFTMPAFEGANSAPLPSSQYYSRAKAATTLGWRDLLSRGMKLTLPDRDLQASWEANQIHLLTLHDGPEITPGPDIYHSAWVRDAAYMAYALSISGHSEAAAQLLKGFAQYQQRNGAIVSQRGEWDGTGQAIWAIARHLQLHPDPHLQSSLLPTIERGARWLARTLSRSPDGLMPPGISAEHLGPPDRYYWDNLWSLAGLQAAYLLAGRGRAAAGRLRRTISDAWKRDAATLRKPAVPAAPGRGIDIGMIGSLVAWFPLELAPPDSPLLQGTLAALEDNFFYEGALFVNTGHSGWGTYLNMRIAGCRLLQGSPRGLELVRWLLRHASPTFNWPEAIHPRSLGGSAGDGQHGWASAEWLMVVRSMLLREQGGNLLIAPSLPADWLSTPGELAVQDAPTRFGPLNYALKWDAKGTIRLQLDPQWRVPPAQLLWPVPLPVRAVRVDGADAGEGPISLSPSARLVEVELGREAEH